MEGVEGSPAILKLQWWKKSVGDPCLGGAEGEKMIWSSLLASMAVLRESRERE